MVLIISNKKKKLITIVEWDTSKQWQAGFTIFFSGHKCKSSLFLFGKRYSKNNLKVVYPILRLCFNHLYYFLEFWWLSLLVQTLLFKKYIEFCNLTCKSKMFQQALMSFSINSWLLAVTSISRLKIKYFYCSHFN